MKVREVESYIHEDKPDARTVGLEIAGDALVSVAHYGGKMTTVTIHDLDRADLYKLVTELTHILNDVHS